MNREGQPEQPGKAPITPDPANAEPAQEPTTSEPRSSEHQASTAAETSNEAADRSSGITVTVQLEEPKKRPLVKILGALGVLISTLVAFFLGVASSQVSDFVKRSDDCLDALGQYNVGVSSNFILAEQSLHPPADAPVVDNTPLLIKYNDTITAPSNKIRVKCFIRGNPLKLKPANIAAFKSNLHKIGACMHGPPWCSDADANAVAEGAEQSAQDLSDDAQEVPTWGLLQRAQYVIAHWN